MNDRAPVVVRRRVTPIRASYRTCGLPEYDANSLISALPAIRSKDQWLAQLTKLPEVTEQSRRLPSEIRIHYVHKLKHLFIPDDRSLELAMRMDVLIRNGLLSRNPETPALAELLQAAYDRGQRSDVVERVIYGEDAPIASYSLFGVSGSGKTTSMLNVLYAYPQYIIHEATNHHQIVWIKAETPKGGGLRDLAINIIRAFDQVLGSAHAAKFTDRSAAGAIQEKLTSLVVTHTLGALVMDEIQNLSVRKSLGQEEVLNFFQELLNTLRVPIVLMGTPKSRVLFDSQLRHTRRLGTDGSANWAPLELGTTFDVLIEQLWDLLLLREAGELSEAMKGVIYEETQGIRALMADMLLVTQLHALYLGNETITPDFFRNTVRSEFSMVQPFVKALRTKNPEKLTKYEDLCDYKLDELIERTNASLAAAARKGATAPPASASYVDRAISNVTQVIPGGSEHARKWVATALEGGAITSAAALTKAAIQAYVEAQKSVSTE